MTNRGATIPREAVRRLTVYFAAVEALAAEDAEWVSSGEMAEALGLTSSTVRQDLSHLDFAGVSKRGYRVRGLRDALAAMLGADTAWRVVVVGAGNLGRAIAMHEDFARRGFSIQAVFDADPKKIGRRVGGVPVLGMRDMPVFVARNGIVIGIIAVPAPAAQAVADMLIISGIRGILNMALTHVVAPTHVRVVAARIMASLQELTHALSSAQPAPRPSAHGSPPR